MAVLWICKVFISLEIALLVVLFLSRQPFISIGKENIGIMQTYFRYKLSLTLKVLARFLRPRERCTCCCLYFVPAIAI